MYILTIASLMFVFPVVSVFTELIIFKSTDGIVFLFGKWFVFWAVGIRLFLTGLRQAISPRFTAENIFEIKSSKPLIIVQELGFANLAIGILGIATILSGAWITPAAIAGGLFYGFAGFRHVVKKEKNLIENTAMVSDLFVFIILVIYLVDAAAQ